MSDPQPYNHSGSGAQFRGQYTYFSALKINEYTVTEILRTEDIENLINYFITEFSQRYNRRVTGFDAPSLERLKHYSWPDNIRELRNIVERHIALADDAILHIDADLLNTRTNILGSPLSLSLSIDLTFLLRGIYLYSFKCFF